MGRKVARTSRLQLVLERRSMERVLRVQEQISSPSVGATLRAAIDLYYLLVEEQQKEGKIIAVKQTAEGRTEKEIWIL